MLIYKRHDNIWPRRQLSCQLRWSIFSISLQVCVAFAPSPTFWTDNEQASWNHWGQLSAWDRDLELQHQSCLFPEPSTAGLPSQGTLAGLDWFHFLVPVYGIYKNLLCLSRYLALSHDRVTYLDLWGKLKTGVTMGETNAAEKNIGETFTHSVNK